MTGQRGFRAAALALLTAALLAAVSAPALAHAVLIEATPSRHQELPEPPAEVRLLFNEPVQADFNPVAVYNARGERVDAADGRVDPGNARLVLAGLPPLPDGLYSVAYRVASADGHIVADTYAFTVGARAGANPAGAVPATGGLPPVSGMGGIAHGLTQAAALGLTGLAVFFVLIWRPLTEPGPGRAADARRTARWLGGLALVLAAGGLAELGVYVVKASGEPFSLGLLGQGLLATRAGQFFWLRTGAGVVSAALAGWAARAASQTQADNAAAGPGRGRPDDAAAGPGRPAAAQRRAAALWWAAAAAGGLALAALTGQSHAAAAGGVLPRLSDWLHMAGIAPWVGGLLGFSLLLTGKGPAAVAPAQAVPRFSRLAAGSVLVMAATGVYAASLHVPGWEALIATRYGRLLLVKAVLVMAVLMLGAVNLRRRGAGPVRRLVAWELSLIVAVAGVTGFLSTLPPAAVEAALTAGPFAGSQVAGEMSVALTIDPARYGYNTAVVTLTDAAGQPVSGASVGLRLSMPGHNMGPQNPEASETAPGVYMVGEIVFGMGGTWDVEVAALTARGRELRVTFRLQVPSPM